MTVDVEVVGAGFGRTGTMSLYVALNRLGYKTHHMKELIMDPSQAAGWRKAVRDRATGSPTDWRAVLGAYGYNAAVDWPSAAFYKEILAANPNARVVLTLRDFDAWYDSVTKTIYRICKIGRSLHAPWFMPWLAKGVRDVFAMNEELIWSGTFGGRLEDREHAREVYEAHIEEVRRCVPREQLLEFDVRQGWQPLCAFLGKPVPQEPFPHANEAAVFQEHIKHFSAMHRKMDTLLAAGNTMVAAALVAGVTQMLMKVLYGNRRQGYN